MLVSFSVQGFIIELESVDFAEWENVSNHFDQVLKFGGNVDICGWNKQEKNNQFPLVMENLRLLKSSDTGRSFHKW